LYKETSSLENSELEQALIVRGELLDQYAQLTSIKEQLDKVRITPSDKSIKTILEYSRSQDPILS
jgi:hypothetical protein